MSRFDEPTTHALDRQQDRLTALSAQLKAAGLVVELSPGKLVVRHPEYREVADTITCRPREDDSRLWFYTSWNDTIADANLPVDAVIRVRGYLVRRL